MNELYDANSASGRPDVKSPAAPRAGVTPPPARQAAAGERPVQTRLPSRTASVRAPAVRTAASRRAAAAAQRPAGRPAPAKRAVEGPKVTARKAPEKTVNTANTKIKLEAAAVKAPEKLVKTAAAAADTVRPTDNQQAGGTPYTVQANNARSQAELHAAFDSKGPVARPASARSSTAPSPADTAVNSRASGRSPREDRLTAGKIVRRTFGCIGTLLLFVIVSVYVLVFSIAHGPSETMRNALVLSAMQASATKWVPDLFLSSETVDEIVANSQKVTVEQIDMNEYTASPSSDTQQGENTAVDEWANSTDGIIFETVHGSTYKAYILLIKDPSKVYVATCSENFNTGAGMTLFKCVEREHCLAAINGGEFPDGGGGGTGNRPIGLTYSNGRKVWEDQYVDRTFMGFDKNDRLVVSEGMTAAEADAMGIRDAVSFQNNNVLIDNKDGQVNVYYSDANTGTSQRTAIGQRADGTVIFLVTDGRSTSSLGATRGDVIDMMIQYGAVSAAMLDGGSSTMMYYEDYAEKYNIDKSTLDEYQLQGMVNKFKAFTAPRYIPTYFCVRGD